MEQVDFLNQCEKAIRKGANLRMKGKNKEVERLIEINAEQAKYIDGKNKEIEQLKETIRKAVGIIEELYEFCPDAFSYMPADNFIEKWKNDEDLS